MKYANLFLNISLALICAGCAQIGGSSSATSASANSQASSGSLAIVPSNLTIAESASYQFSVSGGKAPYTFYMVSGGGGVIEGSGVYTAPSYSGNAQLEVIDANGSISYANITISTSTSTSTSTLTLSSSSVTVTEGEEYSFTATGGTGVYTFSLTSGLGSITSAGLYTAPSSETGSAQIKVEDTAGDTYYATITIEASVSYTPVMVYMYENSSNNFMYSLTDNVISGYTYEGPAFQIYSSDIANSESLYLCTVPTGGPFLSVSSTCEGNGTVVSTLGYIYSEAMEGFYPLYRFASPNGEHFLETTNYAAGAEFGFEYQGILGYVEME